MLEQGDSKGYFSLDFFFLPQDKVIKHFISLVCSFSIRSKTFFDPENTSHTLKTLKHNNILKAYLMEINNNQNFNHISMSSIEPLESKNKKKGKF